MASVSLTWFCWGPLFFFSPHHVFWHTNYDQYTKTVNLWIFHHRPRAQICHLHVLCCHAVSGSSPSADKSWFTRELFEECGGWHAALVSFRWTQIRSSGSWIYLLNIVFCHERSTQSSATNFQNDVKKAHKLSVWVFFLHVFIVVFLFGCHLA